MWIIVAIIGFFLTTLAAVAPFFLVLFASERLLARIHFCRAPRFLLILVKALRRHPLRTSLTYLAAFVLVAIVTIVWSALYVLDHLTEAKSKDIKIVISERYQANSEMPYSYGRPLCEGAADSSH